MIPQWIFDFGLRKCGHRIILAAPEANGQSPFFELGGLFTGFDARGLGMHGALPSGGYSVNHSVLTIGCLMDIQVKNWRIDRQPQTPLYTHEAQWHWLLVERQMRGYSNDTVNALLAFESGHGPSPVNVAGFILHGQEMPRFKIEPADEGMSYSVIRDDAEGPYTCTFIDHAKTECSWFILHRIPLMDDRRYATLCSPEYPL